MAKPLRLVDAAQHFKLLNRALENHNQHLAVTDLTVCNPCLLLQHPRSCVWPAIETGQVCGAIECWSDADCNGGLRQSLLLQRELGWERVSAPQLPQRMHTIVRLLCTSQQAIQHHQKALTVSLQLKSKIMQSVAMGNIGYVGQLQGEYETVSRWIEWTRKHCLVVRGHASYWITQPPSLILRKAKQAITQHVDLAKSLGDHAAQSKVRERNLVASRLACPQWPACVRRDTKFWVALQARSKTTCRPLTVSRYACTTWLDTEPLSNFENSKRKPCMNKRCNRFRTRSPRPTVAQG